jgi:hypothetical protein
MPRTLIGSGSLPAYGNSASKAIAFKWNSGAGMNTIVDLFALPAYASVWAGGVHILTAFNDSGTDTIDVGFRGGSATDDPDAYATLLAATAVGYIAFDELATTTNIINTKPVIVTARYNAQNSNATAGVAMLTLAFSVTHLA